MGFIKNRDTEFIHLKLTDAGRKMASFGQLRFNGGTAVLSDREIMYDFDRTNLDSTFSISDNRIISPAASYPNLDMKNYDGTDAIPLEVGVNVFNTTIINSAATDSIGVYSALTSNPNIYDYVINLDVVVKTGYTNDNQGFEGDQDFFGVLYPPIPIIDRSFLVNRISNPAAGSTIETYDAGVQNRAPFVQLVWRQTNRENNWPVLNIERPQPDHDGVAGGDNRSWLLNYPFSARTYYGSSTDTYSKVWLINIVRTSNEIGDLATTISGQSYSYRYASREFAGQKQFFQLDQDQRQVGFIYHEDNYTGKTYGDSLIPGSTKVDIPDLMWHRKEGVLGECVEKGMRFTDEGSDILIDNKAKSSYTLLKDDVVDPVTVGRVYYDLKLIVITDPELLTALSYKSNRNWTMPPIELSLDTNNSNGIGNPILEPNDIMLMTYVPQWSTPYSTGESYGLEPILHCGYITEIKNTLGQNAYIKATWPVRSFPYLRSSIGMTTYSGTGWVCNHVRMLAQKIPASAQTGANAIYNTTYDAFGILTGQTLVNSGITYSNHDDRNLFSGWTQMTGAGIFSGLTSNETVISAQTMEGASILLTKEDYTGGTNYSLGTFFTGINPHSPESGSGLTHGNESLFFGNIIANHITKTYHTIITLNLFGNDHNGSLDENFDGNTYDDDAYITEVAIFDPWNRLIAVGKPSNPIKKNETRTIALQLDLEF